MIKEKIVDKVISGIGKKNRLQITPALVSDEKELDDFPLSQLFIYNFDRTNSASKFLHAQGGALNEKIAMIGHPCDGRALIELSKRLQVNIENVFTIIMEDIGIVTPKSLLKLLKAENIEANSVIGEFLTSEKLILELNGGKTKELKLGDKINITDNCSRCFRKKLDSDYDMAITWISLEPLSKQLILKIGSPKGEEVLQKSKIKATKLDDSKVKAFEETQAAIIKSAEEKREKDIQDFLANSDRISEIAKCNMCGICINSCPVCFCVSCILKKQRKDKTIDNLTYQLTRISHVGDSCVGCGKCSSNCPKGLPLSLIFQSINNSIKEEFDYIAGTKELPMPRSIESIKKSMES
ncbi:MAG: hypothetical protein GY870_09605 [archaeon]|nr:hypothetical protein [archaeon]